MKTGNKTVRQFGKRVRELRLDKRWSQQHLASLLDVEQAYISSIERGEYGPSVRRAALISEAFGISLSELFPELAPVCRTRTLRNQKRGVSAIVVRSHCGAKKKSLEPIYRMIGLIKF